MIHKNYLILEEEEKTYVDEMYNAINDYAKNNGIKIAYDDRAEKLVEAIATYLIESKE